MINEKYMANKTPYIHNLRYCVTSLTRDKTKKKFLYYAINSDIYTPLRNNK